MHKQICKIHKASLEKTVKRSLFHTFRSSTFTFSRIHIKTFTFSHSHIYIIGPHTHTFPLKPPKHGRFHQPTVTCSFPYQIPAHLVHNTKRRGNALSKTKHNIIIIIKLKVVPENTATTIINVILFIIHNVIIIPYRFHSVDDTLHRHDACSQCSGQNNNNHDYEGAC